ASVVRARKPKRPPDMATGGKSFSLRAAGIPAPLCAVAREAGVVSFIAGHLRSILRVRGCRRDLIAQLGCRPAALIGKRSVAPGRLTALEPGGYAPAGSRDAVLDQQKNFRVHLHVRSALRGPSPLQAHQ